MSSVFLSYLHHPTLELAAEIKIVKVDACLLISLPLLDPEMPGSQDTSSLGPG